MKYLLPLLLIVGISYAELPDTLKDPATKEVVEYLDSKTSQAVNLSSDFRNVNSTITVSGMLDIGYERIVASGTTAVRAQCSVGKKVLGCGCVVANGVTISCWDDGGTVPPSCIASGQVGVAVTASAYCARIK